MKVTPLSVALLCVAFAGPYLFAQAPTAETPNAASDEDSAAPIVKRSVQEASALAKREGRPVVVFGMADT